MRSAVAVGAGALIAVTFASCSSHSSHPPGGPRSSTGSTGTGVAPSSAPPAQSPGPATSGTVHLAGATVKLPDGWVARELPTDVGRAWCLSPTTVPAVNNADRCALTLRRLPDPPARGVFAVNAVGAINRWPAIGECSAAGQMGKMLFRYGYRTFGGRDADYRRWHYACRNGRTYNFAQYVVATKPAYVLFSNQATKHIRAVMSTVVANSLLPTRRAPLRYEVLGSIESRSHQRDGYHVTVRPCVRRPNLPATQFVTVPGGTADTYVIPDRMVPDQGVTLVGVIELDTDGSKVTYLGITGG